jgi:hypothetical protein
MDCILCLGVASPLRTYRLGDGDGDAAVCTACVDAQTGPGKFERCEDRALGIVLHAAMMEGWSDESSEGDDGTTYDQIGRYVFWTDEQGFACYDEYRTEAAARTAVIA